MKLLLMGLSIFAVTSAYAQGIAGGPPAGFFPQGMANVGSRYETYCLFGEWPCVEVGVKEWGQTCHAPNKGGSAYLDGFVPWGFTYVSWRCDVVDPVGGIKTSGR